VLAFLNKAEAMRTKYLTAQRDTMPLSREFNPSIIFSQNPRSEREGISSKYCRVFQLPALIPPLPQAKGKMSRT
jgi:hypothetical protein